jgi:hypothetical protein
MDNMPVVAGLHSCPTLAKTLSTQGHLCLPPSGWALGTFRQIWGLREWGDLGVGRLGGGSPQQPCPPPQAAPEQGQRAGPTIQKL